MRAKLTLSIPETTVRAAKQIAKMRKTTVSALFTTSVNQWKAAMPDAGSIPAHTHPGVAGLLGIFRPQKSFDIRSAKIREKHG
jgi:hypothetical protein